MNLDPLFRKVNQQLPEDNKKDPQKEITKLDQIINEGLKKEPYDKLRKAGDLNDDGKIDFEDVLILKEVLEGKRKLDDKELECADLNRDGIVDYKDLNLMINLVCESRRAEDRVMELQSVYDELKMKQEQGLANTDMDKIRISTVKIELEQAIADFILQGYEEH
ncbi:MAG: hypothetical protein A3I68_03110 [Candidatus Melainabacteria bacterium RIFCSPLOWO2_02_FULL_35_15]|nr:MAG: hypothetical protein A3F80_04760 [Candidatus Melainabacteria bacterium RIFCSPLOWO2_12_FULL_35_11]OGI13308.1 MAG: hypothetical protein A3I68_03110 [Candidatus Melainabacteria bacterium RIFCSPLOWO2_02_FULL_35_15]